MSGHFSAESGDSTSDLSEQDTKSHSSAKQIPTEDKSLPTTGPESQSPPMSEKSPQSGSEANCLTPWPEMGEAMRIYDRETYSPPVKPHSVLISSAEDSPVRTSPSQESGPDSPENAQDSSLRQPESLTLFSETEDGFLLRMFPDSFPQTMDEISPSYSRRWPTSGFTTSPGESWTADTSECHSEGGAFSYLPDVLVADTPPRFYLSPKAAAGIIRRAKKRGKALPPRLASALRELAEAGMSHPLSPPSGEKDQADPLATSARTSSVQAFTQNTRDEVRYIGPRGEGDHTAALAAQPGMKQTNYLHQEQSVRRLTPTECERLQGFPDGWTILLSTDGQTK